MNLLSRFRAPARVTSSWFRHTFAAAHSTLAASRSPEPEDSAAPRSCVVYRMRAWPSLEDGERTAPVLRALSRMSIGPVTHASFVDRCGLEEPAATALLGRLVDGGCVTRLDLADPPMARG